MDENGHMRVAAAVIRRDGRYLLTQRSPGSHGAGYWEFPGGKIEAAETPGEAVARELVEELGVDIEAADEILVLRHRYRDRAVQLHFIEARITRGDPRPLEVASLGWFTPAEMPNLPVLPADAPLIELLSSREEST